MRISLFIPIIFVSFWIHSFVAASTESSANTNRQSEQNECIENFEKNYTGDKSHIGYLNEVSIACAGGATAAAERPQLTVPPAMIDMGINIYNGICKKQAPCMAALATSGINLMKVMPNPVTITAPMVETGVAVYEDICNQSKSCLERVLNAAANDEAMQPTVSHYMDAMNGKTKTIPDKTTTLEMLRKFQ